MAEAAATRKDPNSLSLEELKARLSDPVWRINNLYSVIDDNAQTLPFLLNEEQQELLSTLHHSNIILKARQLGFTTLIAVFALDQCLFNKNFTAVIIAHTKTDAEKIFRNKVRKVYDLLPKLVRDMSPIASANTSEIVFANGSSISVTTSSRGGTVNLLHVSEMGKIARKYPEKASEIVSGAFESVPVHGLKFVESTAEGRAGWFFDAVMTARRLKDSGGRLTPLDFKLHFTPWWVKKSNRINPEGVFFSEEERLYFAELELKHGIKTDLAQRAWYVKKKAQLGELMLRENPSHVDEAFQASVEGMILAQQMKALRLMRKIGPVPYREGVPLNSFWDFGVNDHNSIWLHQRVGASNRFPKFFEDQNKGLRHYWELLEGYRIQLGGKWGKHYLPHDADTRMQGADVQTKKQILIGLGMVEQNIVVVPRIPDLNTGIDLLKTMLVECEIDEEGCKDGIDHLDNYSRDWDDHIGDWKAGHRHDIHSHAADSLRQFAQSWASGAQQANSGSMAGVGYVEPVGYGRGGY